MKQALRTHIYIYILYFDEHIDLASKLRARFPQSSIIHFNNAVECRKKVASLKHQLRKLGDNDQF